MNVIYKCCCGIDVHKMKLVACLKKGNKQEVREFGAKTKDIREMADWLISKKCEMIAMESTACYWKPLVNIFELNNLDYMIINAKDYKNVPGKKTDVADSEWIADLLMHGLLRASYIPNREQRELREATRYRKKIIEERSRAISRIQKILEGANIKVASIISDITGMTGMSLLEYILNNDGEPNISDVSPLVSYRIKASLQEVVDSIDGIITPFQKRMILEIIKHIEELNTRIDDMNSLIEEYMIDYEKNIEKLIKIPGIGKTTAQIILAEIGQDMSRFPTENHISSWAGICPGNNESAGKRRSGKTRKGNTILKSTLVQCAKAASKNKSSFFHAQYQRLVVRRGPNKATVAVGHSLLIAIYHVLKDDTEFIDLGSNFYNKFNVDKKINSYLKKLKELGWTDPNELVQPNPTTS